MKKNGFTLVELLAVIVILSVIVLITVISVNSTVSETKGTLSELQIKNIEDAAKTYYLNEGMNIGNTCINVSDLIDKGYVDSDSVIDPKDREEMLGSVNINYKSNKFTPKYQSNECKKICRPVTTATTGNVPEGKYEIGDEYTCEVKDGVWYTFFLLSKEDNNIELNLIMYSNINDDGVPVDSNEVANKGFVQWNESGNLTEGPVTAINYLNRATSSWDNIDNLDEVYTESYYDEYFNTSNKYTINLTGKARMIYVSESYEVENNNFDWIDDYGRGLNDYPINEVIDVSGYWTMNTWYGSKPTVIHSTGDSMVYVFNQDYNYGVRPVIKITKSNIY